jgi:hypothetical protein
MMATFGWTDPKMPAHYIAQANREKLGISGVEKIVAFDQSQSLDDFFSYWRAFAFGVFSRGCEDPLRHKVHFGAKSASGELVP